MREWIRVHPWKTEILPGLMLLAAIVTGIAFRRPGLELLAGQCGLSPVVWYVSYAASVLFLAALMWLRIYIYHWWAAREHRWRLNRVRSVTDPVMAIIGLFSGSYLAAASGTRFLFLAAVWCVLGGISWMITLNDELGRSDREFSIPQDTLEVSAARLRPGEQFYLRDIQTNWWMLAIGGADLLLAGFLWWVTYTADKNAMIWAVLVTVFAISQLATFRTAFVVTSSRVFARMGFHYVSIPVRDIRSCKVEVLHAYVDYGGFGHRVKRIEGTTAFVSRSGAGLRIETIKGRKYLMTIRNADEACALINAAIERRSSNL